MSRRPLILQHDPGYPELSCIWISSMLGLLVSAVSAGHERESATGTEPSDQGPGRFDPADAALMMVASISARGNAEAALAYHDRLRRDDYYTRGGKPPGRWAGEGAERLSLQGPVTPSGIRGGAGRPRPQD